MFATRYGLWVPPVITGLGAVPPVTPNDWTLFVTQVGVGLGLGLGNGEGDGEGDGLGLGVGLGLGDG